MNGLAQSGKYIEISRGIVIFFIGDPLSQVSRWAEPVDLEYEGDIELDKWLIVWLVE